VAATFGVADAIGERAADPQEIAARTGVDADALRRILRLLVAHGVFDVDITNGSMGTIEGLHIAENLNVDHPFFKPYR